MEAFDLQASFAFQYPFMNDVMRVMKDLEATVLQQNFEMDCRMTVQIRASQFEELTGRLAAVESLVFDEGGE